MSEEKISNDWENPVIKHLVPTKWGWVVSHPESVKGGLTLGKNVDIGYGTYVNSRYGVTIDDDVMIGSHCAIYSHDTIGNKKGEVWIKKGARIGSHTVILPGSIIPDDTVVPAFSIITIKGIQPLGRGAKLGSLNVRLNG